MNLIDPKMGLISQKEDYIVSCESAALKSAGQGSQAVFLRRGVGSAEVLE